MTLLPAQVLSTKQLDSRWLIVRWPQVQVLYFGMIGFEPQIFRLADEWKSWVLFDWISNQTCFGCLIATLDQPKFEGKVNCRHFFEQDTELLLSILSIWIHPKPCHKSPTRPRTRRAIYTSLSERFSRSEVECSAFQGLVICFFDFHLNLKGSFAGRNYQIERRNLIPFWPKI